MKRTAVLITLVFAAAVTLFAQKRESLAVFAFTGGNPSDGEAIASSLTRQAALRNAFNRTTLITRNTIATMNFEQRFQRNSGLTDADTIFELGKALNASHVIAGYITRLGDRNLVIVSIMDIESLQQIAGDYRAYRTIEEIDTLIPDIAKKLAGAVPRNTSALPGLSVPPFNISSGVNQNEAMALAQILSCDLANLGKYAVLPRTDSIDKVMEEQRRQRTGATDQERIKRLGAGRNAKLVLSGSVQRLGNLNKFAVDILDILDGSFIDGHEESYNTIGDGLTLMASLSGKLTGGAAAGGSNPRATAQAPTLAENFPAFNDTGMKPAKKTPARAGNFEIITGKLVRTPIDMSRFYTAAKASLESLNYPIDTEGTGFILFAVRGKDWWCQIRLCYWNDEYWYEYINSHNLDANPARNKIHSNYQGWIARVEKQLSAIY